MFFAATTAVSLIEQIQIAQMQLNVGSASSVPSEDQADKEKSEGTEKTMEIALQTEGLPEDHMEESSRREETEEKEVAQQRSHDPEDQTGTIPKEVETETDGGTQRTPMKEPVVNPKLTSESNNNTEKVEEQPMESDKNKLPNPTKKELMALLSPAKTGTKCGKCYGCRTQMKCIPMAV
jgi:hypothetical protein